ncbi:MAG TPA: stage 0 sporulation protein [candidate division WOR-3 bacterium]|uniref:Stage 0 sporulation protein n=1 Tax=candidate division WOR-3 bacterium TaxID=2052148 RepID=A0A7V0T464_UNCW3|nr:stage 0 sporulation protein [candidate division WOR-3 bacterium]
MSGDCADCCSPGLVRPEGGAGRNAVVCQLHVFRTEVFSLPLGLEPKPGEMVIVHDEEGEDMGRVTGLVDAVESSGMVVRLATEDDMKQAGELAEKTQRVLELFRRQRDRFGLKMKVVDAHWRWDRKKVCFYFISEQRLDFRALHKTMSSALNARVAIKQVGVRDHARMVGGLGACGREVCCRSHLSEMIPITLRMARLQDLFVEPAKISGICGKLLCCLKFEEDSYREALASMPRVGGRVRTRRGPGEVIAVDVPLRRVNVKYDDEFEQVVALEELVSEDGVD